MLPMQPLTLRPWLAQGERWGTLVRLLITVLVLVVALRIGG